MDIEKIKEMGIYELRSLARELGANSPTTLKREQLLELIEGLSNGSIQPVERSIARGRPAKSIKSIKSDLKRFVIQSKSYNNDFDLSKYNFMFQNSISAPPLKYSNTDETEVSATGIVDLYPNNCAKLIDNNLNAEVYIGEELIKSYALKNGSKINLICKPHLDEKNVYVAININEESLVNNAIDFSCLKSVKAYKKVEFNNKFKALELLNKVCPLYMGQIGLLSCSAEIDMIEAVNSFVGGIKQINNTVIYGNFVNLGNEKNILERGLFHDVMLSDLVETTKAKAHKFELMFDKAKRDVENGKDVVIFTGALKNIYRIYYQLYLMEEQPEAFAKECAVQILKYFFNFAIQSENAGSLTIIGFARDNDDLLPEYNEIINYKVSFTKREKNFDSIDFVNSFSLYNGDMELYNRVMSEYAVSPNNLKKY